MHENWYITNNNEIIVHFVYCIYTSLHWVDILIITQICRTVTYISNHVDVSMFKFYCGKEHNDVMLHFDVFAVKPINTFWLNFF